MINVKVLRWLDDDNKKRELITSPMFRRYRQTPQRHTRGKAHALRCVNINFYSWHFFYIGDFPKQEYKANASLFYALSQFYAIGLIL